MRKILYGVALGLAATALVAGSAYAQQAEEVKVEASRIVKEKIGRAPSGAPINAISLSYRVSYADLDLKTSAGANALEKRVNEAAQSACKEITRLHPMAQPGDAECVRAAVGEAMVRVHEAVAAAGKAPPK
jgi:UrcA family protein